MNSVLSYRMIGKGKPVVLLHGFLENKNMWNFLLTEQDSFQYILIDLPGHGESNNYSIIHTMDFMAEKVKEILLKESIGKADFVGHSMGGYVCMALAKSNPEIFNSLCLFFSSPFEDSEIKKKQRERAADLAQSNRLEFIRLGVPNLFNPHELEKLEPQIKIAKEMAKTTSEKGITAAILGMREREGLFYILEEKQFPVLWIYGEYDHAIDIDNLESLIKNLHYIKEYQLPVGHMGHLEAPEISNAIIHQFLNSL